MYVLKMLYRSIPVLVILSLLMACMVSPVSASAAVPYLGLVLDGHNEFAQVVGVDQTYVYVRYALPASSTMLQLYVPSSSRTYTSMDGSITYDRDTMGNYDDVFLYACIPSWSNGTALRPRALETGASSPGSWGFVTPAQGTIVNVGLYGSVVVNGQPEGTDTTVVQQVWDFAAFSTSKDMWYGVDSIFSDDPAVRGNSSMSLRFFSFANSVKQYSFLTNEQQYMSGYIQYKAGLGNNLNSLFGGAYDNLINVIFNLNFVVSLAIPVEVAGQYGFDISGLTDDFGLNDKIQDVVDDAGNVQDDIADKNDIIATAPTAPKAEDIDYNIDIDINVDNGLGSLRDVLGGWPMFTQMMGIVVSMATLSYVLFGKKG